MPFVETSDATSEESRRFADIGQLPSIAGGVGSDSSSRTMLAQPFDLVRHPVKDFGVKRRSGDQWFFGQTVLQTLENVRDFVRHERRRLRI